MSFTTAFFPMLSDPVFPDRDHIKPPCSVCQNEYPSKHKQIGKTGPARVTTEQEPVTVIGKETWVDRQTDR